MQPLRPSGRWRSTPAACGRRWWLSPGGRGWLGYNDTRGAGGNWCIAPARGDRQGVQIAGDICGGTPPSTWEDSVPHPGGVLIDPRRAVSPNRASGGSSPPIDGGGSSNDLIHVYRQKTVPGYFGGRTRSAPWQADLAQMEASQMQNKNPGTAGPWSWPDGTTPDFQWQKVLQLLPRPQPRHWVDAIVWTELAKDERSNRRLTWRQITGGGVPAYSEQVPERLPLSLPAEGVQVKCTNGHQEVL